MSRPRINSVQLASMSSIKPPPRPYYPSTLNSQPSTPNAFGVNYLGVMTNYVRTTLFAKLLAGGPMPAHRSLGEGGFFDITV